MSKKLEIKQRRRAEAEQRERERKAAARKRNLVTLGIALLVVGAVTAAIVFGGGGGGAESIGGTVAEAGCEDLEEFEEADSEEVRNHVDEGTDVEYETTPGVYGDHWPPQSVSAPGFFSAEVEEERLVHNMEHGQVVFFYDPDVSGETEDKIRTLVDQQEGETIAVPFDGLDKPFVMAAWGALQACDEPTQPVVDEFRTQFQGRGPEQIPGIEPFEA